MEEQDGQVLRLVWQVTRALIAMHITPNVFQELEVELRPQLPLLLPQPLHQEEEAPPLSLRTLVIRSPGWRCMRIRTMRLRSRRQLCRL